MTQLSQLHRVNNTIELEHFNCEPDDVVVVHGLNFMYRFGDQRGASYNYVTVSRQRSDKHNAPIDTFSNVIHNLSPRRLMISVNPANQSVRRRFPWINAAWHNVDLTMYYDEQTNDICLQTVDVLVSSDSTSKYSTGHANVAVAKDASLLNVMIRTIKDQTSVVQGWLCGYRSGSSHQGRSLKFDINYLAIGELVRYSDDDHKVYIVHGRYANIQKEEANLRSKGFHVTTFPPDRMPCDLTFDNVVKKRRFNEVWHPTSLLRWPRHRVTLFDVALALGQYLPAYVLLEIVDWLPLIEDQSRLKKVEVLEGVCESMRRMNKLLWYN